MKHYTIREAFDILRENKITTHEESVRRWLRQGVINGIPPASRRKGWRIRENDLSAFIQSRLPDGSSNENITTHVVNDKETIRAEMWWEMVTKYMFEGAIEPKRKQIKACAEHKKYSPQFEQEAWDIISRHKRGYANPYIPFLLDAFLFNGKRIRMDDAYAGHDEKVLYPLLEHIRQEKGKGT